MKTLLLLVILILPLSANAQSSNEVRLAKAVLNQLQTISFAKNREYCGYLGYDRNGVLFASNARKGGVNGCRGRAPRNMNIVASYHTHGAFAEHVPAEFPSSTDLEGDEEEGIDGYISTPGGRLWYSDGQDLVVSQICGIGCLQQDPHFRQGLDGRIHVSYSLQELIILERQR